MRRFYWWTGTRVLQIRVGPSNAHSDTASFRVLAAMIASGDALLWQQQDVARFNSCWQCNDTED